MGVTVYVTPTTAYKSSTLDCGFTVSGNMTTYLVNVTWLNNGVAHDADNETAIYALDDTLTHTSATGDIESADLTKGQSWQCVATAYDTEGDSVTTTSAAVVIQNSAPAITSTADTTAQTLEAYSYTVTASDADSDPITYSLTTAPANMTISAGGVISWTPSEDQSGSHSVVVQVSDGTDTGTQSYTLSVSNEKLYLNKLSADCGPENCDDNVDEENGGSIDEVRPGSTIELDIRVENIWPDDTDDHDIENIEVEAVLEEMGDEDEQEESAEFDDIRPGDRSETVTLEFTVPNEVDEDTYNLEITITGEDEDGTEYEISRDIEVEVKKENHKIAITKAEATPSVVSCSRNIDIRTTVKNIGSKDEDDVELTLSNSVLGISKSEFFDLEEGDYDDDDTEWSDIASFKIADSVPPGTYEIEVKAYYEDDDEYEKTTIPVIVQACSTTGTGSTGTGSTGSGTTGTGTTGTTGTSDTEEKVEVISAPSATQVKATSTAEPVSGEQDSEESFTDSTTFLVILIIAVIALFVVAVMMVYVIIKK